MRSTGLTILLFFVTFGIWSFVYYFQTHEEMKKHSGEGIGGVLGLVLSFFVGFASPYLSSCAARVKRSHFPTRQEFGKWLF